MNYTNLTLETPKSPPSPSSAHSQDVRPSCFDEFVGQSQALNILRILTASAMREHRPVGHLLFAGAPGLGKTSLARIVADTMGGRLIEMIGGNLNNSEQITSHLLHLEWGDVLFVDEIHALPRSVEEVLYPAMEDGVIPVVEQGWSDVLSAIGMANPSKPKHRMATLPPFTMIGATTSPGLLSQPLRDRFAHTLQLEPYSTDELALIVTRASARIGFPLPHHIAVEIARRSRGTARIAISHLTWLREYSSALGVQANHGVRCPRRHAS
jgi:holliday junction DNA helicase RuvB